MDISALKQFSPTVKINPTTKSFFNKFLFKANFYVPGGRLIVDNHKPNIEQALKRRIELLSIRTRTHSVWMNSYSSKMSDLLKKDAIVTQLNYFKSIKNKYKDIVKMRVEEPTLSIYTNDQNILEQIISGDQTQRLKEIWLPQDDQTRALLNQQVIFVKKPPKYQYRIYLKLGKVDYTSRQQIAKYLCNLDNQVEMIKSCDEALNHPKAYNQSTYFYCNDENIIFMIQILNPNAISGIYKLLYSPLNNSKE